MIRLRGTVEYKDGRVEAYVAGSSVFVAWEAYCRRHELEPYGQANVNTLNAYAAYVALGVEAGFEVWLRDVLDVDSQAAAEAVPPTPPAPTPEFFSSSPSPWDGG